MKISSSVLLGSSLAAVTPTTKITRNQLYASGLTVYPEYELSVDVRLRTNTHRDWSNLFAFQVDDDDADDSLWHGENGDRIPAAYLAAGTQKLHVCSSVNDNWNYCWNSDDMGTGNWFNLKVKQSLKHFLPTTNNIKDLFVPNNYDYKVMYDNADTFKSFDIDASDFTNDIHIGFSATDGHEDKKWEIVLGGWSGTRSVIRSKNQWPAHGHAEVITTYEEFKAMRNNFRVTVSDGSIVIKDLDTEKVFMKYKSDDIVKSDLKFMLVAGGWGGSGHFHKVEPKGGEPPLQGSHYFYEIFVNDELKHSVINKTPRTFENVKGEMANGLPLSVKGVYKNLSFQTTKPDKPVELKLDKLLDKIDEIFDQWASKPEKTQNLRDKWEDMSIKFSDKYVKLQKHCDFPSTWKDVEYENAVDRYVKDDPCTAMKQMVKGFEKWADTFTADCRKLDEGTELDWAEKQMKKVEALGERSKQKLQCMSIGK